MNNQRKIFKVSVELNRNNWDICINPWKLLIETNRYYEIKPEDGQVKRLYKEKLNSIVDETKSYKNGLLYSSAFCTEDHIDDMYREIVKNLQSQITTYLSDLHLNQRIVEQQLIQSGNGIASIS